ncbi:hypothetical protein DWQ67_11995 [Galactobacter caseinivorans]|uniref:Uncharacterized protein n=1 Tax=Galactobacter caseinivorans TaxID=2676123 RepID=A0A496PFS6_9MICC|nr:hypothetical protein DWQ67_11995 [Galactobacter caseinivorans]
MWALYLIVEVLRAPFAAIATLGADFATLGVPLLILTRAGMTPWAAGLAATALRQLGPATLHIATLLTLPGNAEAVARPGGVERQLNLPSGSLWVLFLIVLLVPHGPCWPRVAGCGLRAALPHAAGALAAAARVVL